MYLFTGRADSVVSSKTVEKGQGRDRRQSLWLPELVRIRRGSALSDEKGVQISAIWAMIRRIEGQ
jgi:hypothetical protein